MIQARKSVFTKGAVGQKLYPSCFGMINKITLARHIMLHFLELNLFNIKGFLAGMLSYILVTILSVSPDVSVHSTDHFNTEIAIVGQKISNHRFLSHRIKLVLPG